MRLAALPFLAMLASGALTPHAAAASQRVSLKTDDGVVLAGTWYEPASRAGPAVILIHMLGRSRHDFEALATRLSAEGVGALALDLRGHGESQGAVGSSFAAMVADVRAARRFVAGRSDVLPGRVGLVGASLGANLVALEAADDPGVRSMVLLSPSLEYRGLRIEPAMRKYGTRPALLVASDDDPYASRSVVALQKGSRGRETLELHEAGHGTIMLGKDDSLIGSLVDWLRRTLL